MKKQLVGGWLAALLSLAGSAALAQTAATADKKLTPEAELEKIVEKYPFKGSTLMWWHSFSALTLNPGAEQTYNPNYSWMFRFWPRYAVTDKLKLGLKLDINLELTNADDTTKYHEAQLGDTWFDISYGPFKESVTGITFTPSLRFILPTSKAAQARSLYTSIGPGFTLARTFKLPAAMDLSFAYNFRVSKHFNKYTTVQYDTPTVSTCALGGADCGMFLHTGVRNPSYDFWNILSADWGITPKLRFSVMVAFYNAMVYDLTAANAPLAGGNTVAVNGAGDVGMRTAIWYYLDLSYQFHPAFSAGVGVSTFNPQLADDSTYRAPFFNRFTELAAFMTFHLDHLVALFDRRK